MTQKHQVAELPRQGFQAFEYVAPVGLVAAFKLVCPPANHVEPGSHGAGTFPSAPAINQGPPLARPSGKQGVEMNGYVLRHHGGASACGVKWRRLVQGADFDPLLVA